MRAFDLVAALEKGRGPGFPGKGYPVLCPSAFIGQTEKLIWWRSTEVAREHLL